MAKRRYTGFGKELEAAALAKPVCLELGVGSLGGSGAGDGDEVALRVGKGRGMGLKAGTETAADQVPIVGFSRGAFAGDKGCAKGGQGRIG